MVKTKFKTDELKNINEYVIECLKATLKSYPSDNEYLVDISFETADGIYFHTEVDFVLCDLSYFNGEVFVLENFITIRKVPQYQLIINGKVINNTLQLNVADIESYISDWLNF